MENHYVYLHTRPDTGEVFYVGKGSGNRMNMHYDRNAYWWNIVNKCGGVSSISSKIIAGGLTEEEAFNFERIMISSIKDQTPYRLCNMNGGGKGGMFNPPNGVREKLRKAKIGHKLSDEHKAKLLAVRKGIPLTEEARAKISAAMTGKKRSEETKEKIRLANIGKKHSEETKLKMSLSHKERPHPRVKHSEALERARIASLGRTPWNKGKQHTEEHKAALKAAWVKRKERAGK